ncbi:MAG: hypothetical protein K1X88_10885 [Nannocystaceae bacterium]|nr:hypothetical protein [Nannocystaceae bacterium]
MNDVPGSEQFVELAKVPTPALFFGLLSQRFTGTVMLDGLGPDGGPATLWFRGGMPVRTDLVQDGSRLGELAISQAQVPAAAVEDALARTDGRRLGEVLVESGALPEAKLGALLRLQCMRRAIELFALTEGTVRIVTGADVEPALLQVNVLELIHRGVTARYDLGRVRHELRKVWTAPLRATAALERYVEQFKLKPEDGAVIAFLTSGGEGTVEALGRLPDANPQRVAQIAALLWHCRMVEAAAVAPPPGAAEDPVAFEQALVVLEQQIEANADPNVILALATDADAEAIESAFTQLAARFDPRTLPPEGGRALHERLTVVNAALARVRSAARHRRQALAEIAGLRMVAEGKHARGLALLDEAVDLGAHGPEIECARTWARLQLGDRSDAELKRTDAQLDRILLAAPDVAAGHYYRGFVLAGLNKSADAAAAFKRALELDPRMVDAERQLRALQRGERLAAPRAAPAAQPQRKRPEEFAIMRVDDAPKHELLTRGWKRLYWITGVVMVLFIIANIVLRLDLDF